MVALFQGSIIFINVHRTRDTFGCGGSVVGGWLDDLEEKVIWSTLYSFSCFRSSVSFDNNIIDNITPPQ